MDLLLPLMTSFHAMMTRWVAGDHMIACAEACGLVWPSVDPFGAMLEHSSSAVMCCMVGADGTQNKLAAEQLEGSWALCTLRSSVSRRIMAQLPSPASCSSTRYITNIEPLRKVNAPFTSQPCRGSKLPLQGTNQQHIGKTSSQ